MRVTEIATNPSHNNIHLYFDYNPNYPLANHYKAIVKTNRKINTQEFEPHIHSQVTHKEKLGIIRNINYESYSKEYRFPTHLFIGLTPTPVDFLPGNIDGLKLYKLSNVQPKDCWKSAYDLRHFKMHTRRKGFRGKIKVGFCSGNYVCKNDECPYRKSNPELKRNEQNWNTWKGGIHGREGSVQTLWCLGNRKRVWSKEISRVQYKYERSDCLPFRSAHMHSKNRYCKV